MKHHRILWRYIRPYWLYIIIACILVALQAYVQIQLPFIIKFAIDNVLGVKAPNAESSMIKLIYMLGDVEFYRANLHMIALLALAFKALDAGFEFTKAKIAARGATKMTKGYKINSMHIFSRSVTTITSKSIQASSCKSAHRM